MQFPNSELTHEEVAHYLTGTAHRWTLLKYAKLIWWTVYARWAQLNGRWHVFRDRPSWFVACVALIPDEECSGAEGTLDMRQEAIRELELRVRRAKQKDPKQ